MAVTTLKSKMRLDETDPSAKAETKQKKPRMVSVKNPSFFLYKKVVGNLSLLGSYQTEAEICNAYEKALDDGIPEEEFVGFKGRFLEFTVKETKRRIAVR